jgi:excisionase family DNA binding protein
MNKTAKSGERLFENLPDLLTVEEAAGFLDKSPKTIKNWISLRTFPFVEVGNKMMVRKVSLAAWVQRQEFVPWQSRR